MLRDVGGAERGAGDELLARLGGCHWLRMDGSGVAAGVSGLGSLLSAFSAATMRAPTALRPRRIESVWYVRGPVHFGATALCIPSLYTEIRVVRKERNESGASEAAIIDG